MEPEGILEDVGAPATESILPIEPSAELVATAQDVVSYRRFLSCNDRAEAERKGRLRSKPRPFLVQLVGGAEAIAAFQSWSDVVAWHDRNLISAGLQVWKHLPEMG